MNEQTAKLRKIKEFCGASKEDWDRLSILDKRELYAMYQEHIYQMKVGS